jgi:AmmeMemoRadiSam system protein B
VRPDPTVKEPHLAGRWYPAEPTALRAMVDELLAAGGGLGPAARAILVPHGAYRSSGTVAARAFAALAAGARRALVLAPSHYAQFRGAATLPMRVYRTPLGPVELDGERARVLAGLPFVRANPAVYMREQGIEIELPLLQTALPGGTVTPLLLGELTPDETAALAAAVRALLDDETVLVVSSDLVHYGRRFGYLPVAPTDAATVGARVRELDDAVLASILAGDADAFVRRVADMGAPICGRHAIEVLLRALPPGTRGELLAHASSLDADGVHEHVVGYAAVAFATAPA